MTGPRPILYNGLAQEQGIWETRTDPTVDVGTRGMLSDGRVFHYARNNSATNITIGKVLTAEVASTDMDDMVTTAAGIGATAITVTSAGSTTWLANELAEGFWCMNSGTTGNGIAYKIKSNLATDATSAYVVNLYDPLMIALTGTVRSHVVKNIWMDPVAAPTSAWGVAAGVNPVAVPAGDSNAVYYWAQTWGACSVLAGEGTGVGVGLMNDNAEGRTVTAGAAVVVVAQQYSLGVDGDHVMAYLRVAP